MHVCVHTCVCVCACVQVSLSVCVCIPCLRAHGNAGVFDNICLLFVLGTDYTLSSGSDSSTVTFTPGSAASTCFNISLLTDGIVEGDEYFKLDIVGSSITPPPCAIGFTISQDASAEVLVRDSPNDGIYVLLETVCILISTSK